MCKHFYVFYVLCCSFQQYDAPADAGPTPLKKGPEPVKPAQDHSHNVLHHSFLGSSASACTAVANVG